MNFLLSSFIGFVLGSIPTAYLLLKKSKGVDITESGSGNMGAMNAFEVSNSKFMGILVLIIDMLKGLLSVLLAKIFFPTYFVFPALALIFAVFSHCFNPWLKFKGGRGLATAAGGTILLFPFLPVIWIVLWIILFVMKKNIHFANIWTTVMTMLLIFSSPDIAVKYTFPYTGSQSTMIFFSVALLLLIFIKHIEPLKELIAKNKIRKGDNDV